MDKIKTVKIKNPDGSVSEESYTISVDARNVDMDNGKELQETIGTIDIDTDGNIAEQLENLNDNIDDLNIDIKKKAYFFDTIADMKNANLKVGDYACTLVFYVGNDGGAGNYQIISGNYTDDGGSYHRLNNNLYAKLIIINEINVKQFGAYGDEIHDDTNAIQNAFNNNCKNIVFPNGVYNITETLTISQNSTKIRSLDLTSASIKVVSSNTLDSVLYMTGLYHQIEGLNLRCGNKAIRGLYNKSGSGIFIKVNVSGAINAGIESTGYMNKFEKCTCNGSQNYGFYIHGVNVTQTSNVLINCYALNIEVGFYIDNLTYSNLISCAVDYCTIGYKFSNFREGNVLGCGVEWAELAIDMSQDEYPVEEYPQNISLSIQGLTVTHTKESETYNTLILMQYCSNICFSGFYKLSGVDREYYIYCDFWASTFTVKDHSIPLEKIYSNNHNGTFLPEHEKTYRLRFTASTLEQEQIFYFSIPTIFSGLRPIILPTNKATFVEYGYSQDKLWIKVIPHVTTQQSLSCFFTHDSNVTIDAD